MFYCLFLEVWISFNSVQSVLCLRLYLVFVSGLTPLVCVVIISPVILATTYRLPILDVLDVLPECMLFLIPLGTLQDLCHYPHFAGDKK